MVSFDLSRTTLALREFMHEFAHMHSFEGTGQIERAIIAQDLVGLDCK